VLDFGVARCTVLETPAHDAPVSATYPSGARIVGTPAYMAPEQLRAEKVDGRADQFAWAVMAWELLAGRKPWVTTNAPELIAAVLTKPAPPLVVEGVPPTVAAAIGRALSKPAGDRFPTMDALVGVLQGERVVAPSRRLPLGVALVAFALVAVAAIGVTRLMRRPGVGPTPAATAPKPSEALLRFPCPPARRAPDQPECGYGLQAWCDPQGQQIACCREGLAPLDGDGVCGCPPGGSMSASECAKPLPHPQNYGLSLVFPIGERIADCPRDIARDVMDLELHIDPDGRVFGTRIAESRAANAELQRCVLEKMRGMTFAPPPGGFYSDRIPLTGLPVVAPLTGPLRFPCPDPSKVKLCQLNGEIPWCDADGKWLACCAKPLVALDKDGLCGCPPGGTTGGAGGCPTAKYGQDYDQWFVPSLAHRAITMACGPDGLSVGYDLEIDPDGRVFKANITAGASVDVELQRCVLTALRRMHVDPPPDGQNSVGYGAIYKFEHHP
jgi:Protein kinase domain